MVKREILFSIVIPTYNRPRQIDNCLQAITQLRFSRDRFEVVVVNDGSQTRLDDVCRKFDSLIDLTLINQQHAGRSVACNTGAALAKGNCLAFTDDDCMPAPDWLQKLESHLLSSPGSMIGGQTINAIPENLYSSTSQLLISYLYSYYNRIPDQARFLAGNNLAVPRDRYQSIGGMNIALSLIGGAEDRELFDRWIHYGYPAIYAAEAIVYHAHSMRLRNFLRQHYNYGRGAHYFHRARIERGATGRVRIEPGSFYLGLLRYPFKSLRSPRSLALALFLAVSQASYVAGFIRERLGIRGGCK